MIPDLSETIIFDKVPDCFKTPVWKVTFFPHYSLYPRGSASMDSKYWRWGECTCVENEVEYTFVENDACKGYADRAALCVRKH